MKVQMVLGARLQFIKAATVSRAIKARDDIEEIIVHTGHTSMPTCRMSSSSRWASRARTTN